MPKDLLDGMTHTAPLSEVLKLSNEILAGKIRGRTVIDVNA
jgi:acrylyl-CoA reductase (NADPH)